MKKRFGFTLAEVLITLGIIGVVAAMTIPTLIQNTNSVKFSSQFKKSLSTINNAIEMAQAHFDSDLSTLNAACTDPGTDLLDINSNNYVNSVCGLFNSTLANSRYLGTVQQAYATGAGANARVNAPDAASTGTADTANVYALPDGSWLAVPRIITPGANPADPVTNNCTVDAGVDPASLGNGEGDCHGFIDVNGLASPNRAVRCSDGNVADTDTSREDDGVAANARCIVRKNGQDVGDVFPIVFHDGYVSPSSIPANIVLGRL